MLYWTTEPALEQAINATDGTYTRHYVKRRDKRPPPNFHTRQADDPFEAGQLVFTDLRHTRCTSEGCGAKERSPEFMGPLLEVIVTSLEDSVEAEAGGADRLELVAALEQAGLTPPLEVVEEVVRTVRIPVRVMLRQHASMSIESSAELRALQRMASQLSRLPIDGLVAGFVQDGSLDIQTMQDICAAAPQTPITFHRAFDTLPDQARALEELKEIRQVDRLLTRGSGESWPERLSAAFKWQQALAPRIKVLFAVGRDTELLTESSIFDSGLEIHVGRAARSPQTVAAPVSRVQVSALKRMLKVPPELRDNKTT